MRMQAELALRESSRDEIERSLQQIARGSQQATRLANQLMSLARAENHALITRPLAAVDLVAITRQMTEDWVPAALAAGHDLGFEAFAETLPCKGNATLLGEMLKNLLDNAIRYTPSSGRITVRVFGGEPISLEVEDTGPGVAPAQRERVFEPFYRAPEAGSEGTGLGLAIVREIARQHGASVTLHAADPHGLIVRVVFTATEATTEAV
ncbi:MAG: sensor histidine kinase [Burkholderiaceae bacterium]